MQIIDEHAPRVGILPLCSALDVPRASFYRWKYPVHGPHRPRRPPRALSPEERQAVVDLLHEPRFADLAPPEVFATLLDECRYICSIRTMYRVLHEHDEVRERRDQLRHPHYAAPELLATRPNELWSWDITKLPGPAKWTCFHLYVILDVFSRYVVGWMVAPRESAALAERLISETCTRQRIGREQLTLHADRGTSMTSKSVALLLADLGVSKTHSRPRVSNDNPFSEAHFKTLKYRPAFPQRFGCIEDARACCADIIDWYNTEHRDGGLGLLTPHDVHYGLADEKTAHRTAVLEAAYEAHPERFVRGLPAPHTPPREVWINRPKVSNTSAPPSTASLASGIDASEEPSEFRGAAHIATVGVRQ